MTARPLEIALPDGRVLRAVSEGDPDGLLLVFHHGSPGAAVPVPAYDRAAGERGIHLVTYSRPGFGGSSRREGRTVDDCAGDVAAIAGGGAYDAGGLGGTLRKARTDWFGFYPWAI